MSSQTKMFFPLPNYISAGHNRQLHTVSTRWAGSSAADQWPSLDYPRRVRIFGSLATPSTDFIPSKEIKWWNPFTAISPKIPGEAGSHLKTIFHLFNWQNFSKKIFKNGLDTPMSNRCPSISMSSGILISTQLELQFGSIWRWWTREMPWIWRLGYSRHHDREFTFSRSRDWRFFQLQHQFVFF